MPVSAGWKAGAVPFESFFGPEMNLSVTASRFDSSVSWLAAIGHRSALTLFEDYGADAVFARNRELAGALRTALAGTGWDPLELPEANRSTIVSVPARGTRPARLLAALADHGVVGSAAGREPAPRGALLQPRGRRRAGGRRAPDRSLNPIVVSGLPCRP